MATGSNSNWTNYKLNELGFVARGRSRHRPRNDPSLYGGRYAFVQTGDIKAAELYVREYRQTYNDVGLAQSKLWEPGTLCITIAANIAETAILGMPACFPDSIIGFVPNPRKCDVRFIKYYVDLIKLQMQQVSHGTTQDNLSLDKLLRFDVVAPPVSHQRRIASILSAYDYLIESNMRRIRILEEMAQALYREWFGKFRFPGHEKVRMVDSRLGKIPERWEVKPLGEMAEQVRENVRPDIVDPETPYFGLEHLPRKSVTLADWGSARDVHSTKLLFRRGDILFAKIRPYFHKVGIAPVDGLCSSDTIVIRPRTSEFSGLVLGCTSSVEFVEHATATSQGTKMPRANWDVLAEFGVPAPPDPILCRFNGFMADVVGQLHNLLFRNRNLQHTRDLLLPKLISGELDVSELDIAVDGNGA